MANELATAKADLDRLTASLRYLARREINSPTEARKVAETCETLRRPASQEWLRGRIGTLLAQSFISQMPEAMVRAIADDWLAVLCADGVPPEWAVTRACRWWIGPDNPHRHRKPQAGDIAARVRHELGAVDLAEVRVRQFRPNTDEPRQEASEERREEMRQRMADAGNRVLGKLRSKVEGRA